MAGMGKPAPLSLSDPWCELQGLTKANVVVRRENIQTTPWQWVFSKTKYLSRIPFYWPPARKKKGHLVLKANNFEVSGTSAPTSLARFWKSHPQVPKYVLESINCWPHWLNWTGPKYSPWEPALAWRSVCASWHPAALAALVVQHTQLSPITLQLPATTCSKGLATAKEWLQKTNKTKNTIPGER